MSAALFLDIDGTVCPEGSPDRFLVGVRKFPSHIGDVWTRNHLAAEIRALQCRKAWLSAWEDLVTPDMEDAFGILDYCDSTRWDKGHDRWTDWWKADELINAVEPYATYDIRQVIWCDDELADPRNTTAIDTVRSTLNDWCVNLQVFAPDPKVGLTDNDLRMIHNLAHKEVS